MRAIVISAVAVFAAFGAQAEEATPQRPFEFKQLRRSLTLAEAKQQRLVENCISAGGNSTHLQTCIGGSPIHAGGLAGEEMYGTLIAFDEEGMSLFRVGVRRYAYSNVEAAFRAKYGTPCDTRTSEVQNGFGAKFEQVTTTWCFSDGKLDLRRHSSVNAQNSEATFTASSTKPPPPPKVNF